MSAGAALTTWSNRQGSVALSRGESEYYVVVKTAGVVNIWVFVVSTSAKGPHHEVGIGKVRHLEVPFLWFHGATSRGAGVEGAGRQEPRRRSDQAALAG